jgi:hypothetical protein
VPKLSGMDECVAWLATQAPIYGETLEMAPMRAVDHTPIDPITELRMMRPDAEIIPVSLAAAANDATEAFRRLADELPDGDPPASGEH